MEQLQYYFFIFYHSVNWCYAFAIVMVLVLWFFFSDEMKDECKNLLAAVNFSMGMALCLYAVDYAYCLYDAFSDHPKYEWFGNPDQAGLFSAASVMFESIKLVIGLLLVFTYARHSWRLTLLTLMVLSYPSLQQWMLRFYKNYLPSVWGVSVEYFWMIRIRAVFVFISSVLFTYTILYALRWLPHPSVMMQPLRKRAELEET